MGLRPIGFPKVFILEGGAEALSNGLAAKSAD
jgi:hypothetical protein